MLMGLLSLILILLAAALIFWQQFKREQGIQQVEWQGLALHSGHLYMQRLTLQREDAGSLLNIQAEGLSLDWQLAAGARLESLEAQRLALDWQPAPSSEAATSSPVRITRPDPREFLPGWLPRNLRAERLQVALPCAAGRCTLEGQLFLRQGGALDAPAKLELSLLHQGRRLSLDAQVSGPPDRSDLTARARIDQHTRLSLTSIYRTQPEGAAWSGHLELPTLPEAPWLLAWLEQWSGPQPQLRHTGDLQLQADWDWHLAPGPLDAAQLQTLSGHVDLHGNLPRPWPLPGVGQLQGSAALQLRADTGRWTARQLQADLQLQQPAPALLAALPAGLQPSSLHLQLQQRDAADAAPAELPLRLRLTSAGALQLDVEADVLLMPSARNGWLQVDSSRIRAQSSRLQLPPLDARGLRLDVSLTGRMDPQRFALTLDQASSLRIGELLVDGSNPLRLSQLQLDRAALAIHGTPANGAPLAFEVSGPARLRVEQIAHPALRPLAWNWEGKLEASRERQQLAGALGNAAGLSVQMQLQRTPETMHISASLPDSFLRSGNPLAATLSAWPQTLELGTGRLQLDGRLELPAKGSLKAQAQLQLKGVGGLYDRTELSGLDARIDGRLEGEQVRLAISALTLQQANPGIAIGPLQFAGEYRAALAKPALGQLDWRLARSAVLGGEVWLEPASLRLDQTTVLPVHLRGLQLQELFSAYPAEGLSGQGTLDGELPVGFGPDGVRIVDGRLDARKPGGQLQFRSPKISALARSNPAMQVVADALEDFHYDLLSSGVDYDAQGTLRLALKLEGRNPDVERGRPINFSINLEEDIPALLTSLQLTGKVSERVRERVQQHLEQSRSTP